MEKASELFWWKREEKRAGVLACEVRVVFQGFLLSSGKL
jgi:hypothetical protein